MINSNYNNNRFENYTGSSSIAKPVFILLLVVMVILFAVIIAKLEIIGVGVIFGLLFSLIYLYFLFTYPIIGFYSAIALNFILIGVARYVVGIPFGFGIDIILILTYLALFINRFHTRIDWTPAKKDITLLLTIWLVYAIFQLANPEARSVDAWISGRGMSFYPFLLVPLTLLFINTPKRLNYFFNVWAIFSLLATLKGIMQMTFGADFAEQAWLDQGNFKTHVLFGQLRAFSFYSDAGQFGANQGYTGVVFFIYALSQKKIASKFFFIIVSVLGIYGMIMSGTRGALSVPVAGFMTYFVLSKNIKVLSVGITILVIIFIFFKFTSIGQGNDQIRRMRTAFDPNDASLQVRLDNQKILKGYLATRPFGGGIGHAGDKAQRFLPNAFLSNVATDSWYVVIWAELGIVGLTMHLFILFYVIGKASYKVMFKIRDPITKLRISALIAGMAGVMVASYGNAVLGQMPTSLLIYASMAIILNSEVFDTAVEKLLKTVKN
jgi:hypothetical protein